MSFSSSESATSSSGLPGDKNETTRFLGDGVSFKAKLIGILEVSEARGDRMCQEALSDLKMAIRAAGEHKQRITINIAIDGLRLRDEKTGDSLYHHPVHKISFIAQDMTDSRAFGYIFGSPDTGHRFFGIKTDKAASQVVIAMRDLFQVVFALKKKEIELAKQHLDKTRFTSSPLFSDSSISSAKTVTQETSKSSTNESKAGASSEAKSGGTAVADLVDLELELNSLQQGLNQMERITPSDPFGSKDDPFGDSFTSYTKPILPPPPSSGRERSSRTSESSSVFSPRTPHTASLDVESRNRKDFSFSQDFNSSREEPSSGDWFTPPAGNSIFEEPPLVVPEPTKDEKHELAKQEILSQFDVFTDLDPLELKNPPKKVLKDLVSQTTGESAATTTTVFNPTFNQSKPAVTLAPSGGDFGADPFGEDPFVTEDPFADSDFSKQDPFEAEFGDFKKMNNLSSKQQNNNMARSPKTINGTSPRTVQFSKQNTYEIRQLHENPSLDMSSESEAAPEPPPRPTLMQIKPPPLPPKKQSNDLAVKPPPRPPHVIEDSVYLYMDHYSTAPNSLEFIKNSSGVEQSPPIPVPARKSHKFDVVDFSKAPERPQKFHFHQSSDDDYLTPVTFTSHTSVVVESVKKVPGILLPPPQRATRKAAAAAAAAAAATAPSASSDNVNVEGLDITLSQLTLSGLNELAVKLKIPASELSNMTLVQLTNYLSNFIKDKTATSAGDNITNRNQTENEFPSFKADFAANFSASQMEQTKTYDRYAVFRELIQEEIKQTKIDTEPEELREEKEKLSQSGDDDLNRNKPSSAVVVETKETPNNSNSSEDRYAALREIVEIELKMATNEVSPPVDDLTNENDVADITVTRDADDVKEINVMNEGEPTAPVKKLLEEEIDIINTVNLENNKLVEKDKKSPSKYNVIEYSPPLDNVEDNEVEPLKSPKSPIVNRLNPLKSPVPVAITEIMQNSARLTSGSLSDVVSGSSPEVDNTASNSDMLEKKTADAAGETWAIFDQSNNIPSETKEKQAVHSEEGVSPWSSDSKEFGNGSPTGDWRRGDSESGGDRWPKRRPRRDQEGGWWDTSAEPEAQYYPAANRRSTDSYEEEYYDCYDRPRRRKQTSYGHGNQAAAGGHSSSSRDVSPWEEEPRRREPRDQRPGWGRHPRQHSFEKLRDRRHTDSWDEEDDYDEDHPSRFHRHERDGRHESDRWTDDYSDDRRHRRRREGDRERWCCPDWEQPEHDKPPPRYGSGRWSGPEGPPIRRERYYSRESQESPWEDEYSNEADEPPPSHYLTAKRNWKRPSSASEMDRKTGEIKSRHYSATGGSDGERDRRYKPGRRSRSRDSQYSEPVHIRHKSETLVPSRNPHRSRQYQHGKQFEPDLIDAKKSLDIPPSTKIDHVSKCSTLAGRGKKTKDGLKTEENLVSTFPRKSSSRGRSMFENDFVTRENDFESCEVDSPVVTAKPLKGLRAQLSMFEKSSAEIEFPKESFRHRSLKETRVCPRFASVANKPKSLFEDDFSPSDKPEPLPEDISISSIKEENDPNEEDDSFGASNFVNNRRKKFNKHRLSADGTKIKKSDSVNIFAQENDPFDDDFFSENAEILGEGEISPRTSDLRWTDDFEEYAAERK